MKTLLLVDGSSYLYRAFHALPDLRSPAGAPTGVVYGVINMLRRIEKDIPSDYRVCVFDAKGKTFRDDWYPEYKANRPSMPPELAEQIAPLLETIRDLGWPIVQEPGVEADDVIGTLAQRGAEHGLQVVVSTGDKDMAQLVTPQVKLINTMTNESLDEAGVAAKFGVPPNRIVDYLSLIGDTVDNVPGVPKVGPKTAVKWLSEYGSLDAVVAQAEHIGGAVGDNLRATLDWLPQARRLITIRCDLDLPYTWDDLAARAPDFPALAQQFRQYGFKTMLADAERQTRAALISSESVEPTPAADRPSYETILSFDALDAWLAKFATASVVSFDTETTGLDPFAARLVGMSFSITPGEAAYLPLAHRDPDCPDQLPLAEVLARLKPWLEDANRPKLGQNLRYDQHVLANHGIAFAGIVDDTLLMSYVLASHERHNMDDLAAKHLGWQTIHYEDVAGKGAKQIGFADVQVHTATQYAAEDADVTLRLAQLFLPRLAQQAGLDSVYRNIELPVSPVLFRMERNGILLDSERLRAHSHKLGQRLVQLENDAYALAGQPFNLNSPKQLQEILFDKLQLSTDGVRKTPTGGFSTDEEVLAKLALDYPLPKLLLEYRSLAKLKSTYTDKLPTMVNVQTGRVHTHFSQTVAVTGRLASSDPNLQNIPIRTAEGRKVREAFIAPPGHVLVSADYSQIELRIMAHLSDDPGLLAAFSRGEDVHRATAAEVFGVAVDAVSNDQRRYAKTINFGLIYGMSAFGLAAQMEIDRSTAQQYIERYFARYPGVKAYMERTREQAKAQGFVETVYGRRLWLPEINSSNPARRAGAERAAINAPMQGTAADLIKKAMLAVDAWIQKSGIASKLVLQVHDELVMEVPDAELALVCAELPRLMQAAGELAVPLLAEVGSGLNWDAAH